jgi:hypothetical protein
MANSTWRLMPGYYWIGWNSVMCIHIYSDHLVLEGVLQSFVVCYHHETRLLRSIVKSEVENEMEAEF